MSKPQDKFGLNEMKRLDLYAPLNSLGVIGGTGVSWDNEEGIC